MENDKSWKEVHVIVEESSSYIANEYICKKYIIKSKIIDKNVANVLLQHYGIQREICHLIPLPTLSIIS